MCRRYSDAISPTVILDAQTRNNKHIDQRVRKFRTLCSATVSIFVGGMFPLARIIEPAPDLNVFCRLSTVSHADVNAVGAGGGGGATGGEDSFGYARTATATNRNAESSATILQRILGAAASIRAARCRYSLMAKSSGTTMPATVPKTIVMSKIVWSSTRVASLAVTIEGSSEEICQKICVGVWLAHEA
jgi:hypothetical protein